MNLGGLPTPATISTDSTIWPWSSSNATRVMFVYAHVRAPFSSKDPAPLIDKTAEEIHANRGGEKSLIRNACSHRTRPIADSLADFEKMKEGQFPPGQAVLRMKQDLESGNPQMWDIIAYRVLLSPHHRTGDRWKVYPTYDFTHCLVDSFENIS